MEKKVGTVTHYYTNLEVAIVEVSGSLSLGDLIRIRGATTDFTQDVTSMQIEREDIEEVEEGEVIGLKVEQRVREGDEVYLLEEE